MKGTAKVSQGQTIVEGKAGARAGRGGLREKEGRRIVRRLENREMLEGRTAQMGAGLRSGVRTRTVKGQS